MGNFPMNTIDLTANCSTSAISDLEEIDYGPILSEEAVSDFYGNSLTLVSASRYDQFIAGVYDYREEAFDMQKLINGVDVSGGVSPNPTYPNVVSLDMEEPFSLLNMYTNTLTVLAAPRELCVQKALELISSRAAYELNVEVLRMELLRDFLEEAGTLEIDALVAGIKCLSNYILEYFDRFTQSNADFFPYEYSQLHLNRYLFLTKIVFDVTANAPVFNPATVAKPAYTYPEVQARARQAYSPQADQFAYL
jgi:hypothetical protein